MKASEMIRGKWYRLVPDTHGRFTCGGPIRDGDIMCCLNGDQDMQSLMIVKADSLVEPAELKQTR